MDLERLGSDIRDLLIHLEVDYQIQKSILAQQPSQICGIMRILSLAL
jgi:hypothetical protein